MNTGEYVERVYAGILGKMIGVYLGRPVEGWTHERIAERFGEIRGYVHEQLSLPLVVTDDDIGGTITFLRALEDYGFDPGIKARSIGQSWLNYLVYRRTILWWGGLGNSTEHSAYLRLRSGIEAPASGSAALNGTTTANQIGAQIFIDGWALVSPGDPVQAATLAREAATVSHDGDAVDAAVAIAVMEAQAFVEQDCDRLLDKAMSCIGRDSPVARLTSQIRELHGRESDWRRARSWLDENHGYHAYRGACHVMPNYGLIILSLLYGEGDFRRSMTIVNSSGWDTDCNAGNLGCLLGIRNGLDAIEACPDLRLPPRDLMLVSSADGGRAITDAAREACYVANLHLRMKSREPFVPKGGARFHFELPGSTHAFHPLDEEGLAPPASLRNLALPGRFATAPVGAKRALEIGLEATSFPALVAVPVFSPPETRGRPGYELQASPTLYPGQSLRAMVHAGSANAGPLAARLFVTAYGEGDAFVRHFGETLSLEPGSSRELSWKVDCGREGPLIEAGLELTGLAERKTLAYLDHMDWSGAPDCILRRRPGCAEWKSAWVNGVDDWGLNFPESYRLSQDAGTGLLIQGTREWGDYGARARITPFLCERAGLGIRVQGMRRYYFLALCRDGFARLIKELDGTRVLAEADIGVREHVEYDCRLAVRGSKIEASIDGRRLFSLVDEAGGLETGAVALIVSEGSLSCDEVRVGPWAALHPSMQTLD